jgi:hypothetical protein
MRGAEALATEREQSIGELLRSLLDAELLKHPQAPKRKARREDQYGQRSAR